MSLLLSMAIFALVASITPGPVNIVALSSGARYGFRASLRHVTGATVGFTALLVLMGLGLHELLGRWQALTDIVQWAGMAFLLFIAWKLAADDGTIDADEAAKGPSLLHGALMQWLNPKAWIAALAGMGVHAADGETALVWRFAVIYFVICYLSIGCWAWAGAALRRHLREARHVRLFNRAMAALLTASVPFMLLA